MTTELITVRVADIMEYPTYLGSRCMLLASLGLDANWDSEEDLLKALIKSAEDPDCLKICKQSSRCRVFWEAYQRGETPFLQRDPIRLSEYAGHYWVSEGKHRVCMAKRSGVETIEAYVYHLPFDDHTLLQPEGEAREYVFQYSFCGEDRQGEIAVLWVEPPPGEPPSIFSFFPTMLDVKCNTGGAKIELFPGLSYKVRCTEKQIGFLKRRKITEVETEVCINANHANTRIWLLKGAANTLYHFDLLPLSAWDTVFRCGCWRTRHLNRHVEQLEIK
ncbi:hypothetical protein [Marasmitruncus massiliensis]|uniref:hypothetical protein n=1 Tax=Marasmitruncus massiliensis TaxID=1944642 RepID=UPI000C7C04D9|nr:hypothetical protein [Marasmitruncus massiliensis]